MVRRLKRLKKKAALTYRALTAARRALPDYLIIGAQKAGTTSLYAYINQHPQVLPPRKKEVRFYDINYAKGIDWYRAQMPLKTQLERASGAITGEATQYYLYHPAVPRRIRSTLSGVKLITLLRDPVARAYSHYHHEKRRGRETLSFDEAIEAEPQRLATLDSRDPRSYEMPPHRQKSYFARGLYAEQLRRYFDLFPREDILVLFSERFFTEPQRVCDEVMAFLGLPAHQLPNAQARNVGAYDRELPAAAQELRRRYERPDQELSELLGVPVPWR